MSRVLVSRGGDEANLSARYLDCGGDKYGANVGFGIVSFVEPGTDGIKWIFYHIIVNISFCILLLRIIKETLNLFPRG